MTCTREREEAQEVLGNTAKEFLMMFGFGTWNWKWCAWSARERENDRRTDAQSAYIGSWKEGRTKERKKVKGLLLFVGGREGGWSAVEHLLPIPLRS